MNTIWEILILGGACLFLRMLPRILVPHASASDTCFHWYCADIIRENSGSIPLHYKRFFFNNDYDYPFLYHWILALFSTKPRFYVERFSGAIFDTCTLLCLYFFCSFLSATYHELTGLPFIASLIYCFHPALLKIGSGPRIHYGSPRVLGQFLYACHLMTAWYFWGTNEIWALAATLVCGGLIFIASKFAVQVLLFFSLPISLFVHPIYILFPLFSFLIIVLFTRGRVIAITCSGFSHSRYYQKNLQQVFIWPYFVSLSMYLRQLGDHIVALSNKQIGLLCFVNTHRHPLNAILFWYPELSLIGFSLMAYGNFLMAIQPAYVICCTALCCMLLTEQKPFMFLGEGERYMQYAAPFFCILFGQLYVENSTALLISSYCIYGFLLYLYGIFVLYRAAKQYGSDNEDSKIFFEFFTKLPIGNALPIGSYQWHILRYTQHILISGGVNWKLNDSHVSNQDLDLLYGNYPYPSGDFLQIIQRYGVRYILTSQAALAHYTSSLMQDSSLFSIHCRLISETSHFLLFEVKR